MAVRKEGNKDEKGRRTVRIAERNTLETQNPTDKVLPETHFGRFPRADCRRNLNHNRLVILNKRLSNIRRNEGRKVGRKAL